MKMIRVVKKLAARNMQANRTRNIAAILAIALTAMMFTTVFTIGVSMLSISASVGVGMGADALDLLVGTAVAAMIIGSGYLIIYNIFHISVIRDIQFYGRLKTLGASNHQIRYMVFSQALRLCIIGIPLGLISGYVIGVVLIPIVLVSYGAEATLAVHPVIFIGAAVFSLLTVLLSSLKPAAIAGKVSPVLAVKYNDSGSRKTRKIRRHRTATPWQMAKSNLKRNKKRTRLVMISITLGLALMNSFYVYQHSFDEQAYVDSFIQSDLVISGEMTPEMQQQIAEMPGVEQIGRVLYTETTETLNPDVLQRITAYYDEEDSGQQWWIEDNEDAFSQYQNLKQTGSAVVSVYGLDSYTAGMGSVYLGEYDAEKFATGNYVISYGIADNGEGSEHYEVGDIIEIEGRQYELMALIEPAETVKGDLHSVQNQMEIDYGIYVDNFDDSFSAISAAGIFLEAATEEARNTLITSLVERYPDLSINSRLTYAEQFKSQTLAVTAMGYALGLLMAMIGILNFANTMLTTIIARKHEFTMLESIGMAKKQLKRMLVHEGTRYVVFSLILSIAASVLIASTVIQEAVSTSWVASYNFTLAPFAVIAPILMVLAVAIPLICFRSTQMQSLVERLRSD